MTKKFMDDKIEIPNYSLSGKRINTNINDEAPGMTYINSRQDKLQRGKPRWSQWGGGSWILPRTKIIVCLLFGLKQDGEVDSSCDKEALFSEKCISRYYISPSCDKEPRTISFMMENW